MQHLRESGSGGAHLHSYGKMEAEASTPQKFPGQLVGTE